MHKFIDNIKRYESKPFIVNNFIDDGEIELFKELYRSLPIEINNQRQQIIKKKWSNNFLPDLQKNIAKNLN